MDMEIHQWNITMPHVVELCLMTMPTSFSRTAQYIAVVRRLFRYFPRITGLDLDGFPNEMQHKNHRNVWKGFINEAARFGIEQMRLGFSEWECMMSIADLAQNPWIRLERVPRRYWADHTADIFHHEEYCSDEEDEGGKEEEEEEEESSEDSSEDDSDISAPELPPNMFFYFL